MQEQSPDHIFEEFGDCLFSLVNVGRKLGLSVKLHCWPRFTNLDSALLI